MRLAPVYGEEWGACRSRWSSITCLRNIRSATNDSHDGVVPTLAIVLQGVIIVFQRVLLFLGVASAALKPQTSEDY